MKKPSLPERDNQSAPRDADTRKEARRKLKKEKRQRRVQEAASDAGVSRNGREERVDSKKKRKKERTNLIQSAAEPNSTEQSNRPGKRVAEGPEADSRKTKKRTKKASAPLQYAAVGDVELAQSSRPIVRDLYVEHAKTAAMTAAEVDLFRRERGIDVDGATMKVFSSFEQLAFDDALLHAVRSFAMPSPIQSQCWPIILKGHDLIGIAATGSGKTLGFGLPALRHIKAQQSEGVVTGGGPFVLVMAPTRELAQQITDVLQDAGSLCGIGALSVYGGVPKHTQAKALRKGVSVVVGTPGRVADLVQDGTLCLQEVTYLVLDEADRMLDLGFEPEIRRIVGPVRADRQTLMFSATWPVEIQKLAMEFLVAPVRVTIGSHELSASHSVTQTVEVIDDFARTDRLLQLLQQQRRKGAKQRVIVFVLYKKEAPRVEQALQRRGWDAVAIHGDISQEARNRAVERFKAGDVPLLVATDVAARGLDIPDVEMVVNYSFPLTVEDYVHRIGRTGRAGKRGRSHTFFVGKNDKPKAGELVNVLREAGQDVPKELLAFGCAVKKRESKLYGAHFKDVDMSLKGTRVTFDSDSD